MSNGWELTNEELDNVKWMDGRYGVYATFRDYPRAMAKAQAKKLAEWLRQPSMDAHTTVLQVSTKEWEALLKEIK